jgi:hypothetical protein
MYFLRMNNFLCKTFATAKVQLFSESTKYVRLILCFLVRISPIRQIGGIDIPQRHRESIERV